MQALEVVLDVQRPVRGDLEIAVARRIVAELVERQPRQARARCRRRRRRTAPPERATRTPAPRTRRTARAAGGPQGPGKSLRLLEAGHEGHAPVEVEAPRVVAAADLLGAAAARAPGCCRGACRRSRGSAARRAASRASSSGSSRCPASISRGESEPGSVDVAEVAEPLPGAREDALARQRMDRRIEVEGARQRARQRDVGVDREGERHG